MSSHDGVGHGGLTDVTQLFYVGSPSGAEHADGGTSKIRQRLAAGKLRVGIVSDAVLLILCGGMEMENKRQSREVMGTTSVEASHLTGSYDQAMIARHQ